MFAIIQSGSKQYRVAQGDRILVEKLESDAGKDVKFEEVLLVSEEGKVSVGCPTVDKAVVIGTVEAEEKGEKLYPLKKKRRKNYRRRVGHRQTMSAVRIKEITVG
ncbi:MAG: 50S ribosomal protein L21 [bacterium]